MIPHKPFAVRYHNDGTQRLYRFANGYGASVVRHSFSYGNENGLWELAVIVWDGPTEKDFLLCYTTPITDDVIGRLSEEEVETTLNAIEALPHKEQS